MFLKQHLGRRPVLLPEVGHVLNLEEPALFNEMVERFNRAGRGRSLAPGAGGDPRSLV